jgi:tRNA 2-thiouridine synthesizing protein A
MQMEKSNLTYEEKDIMGKFTPQRTLDCRGDACPLPLLKTKKAMADLASGEILEVVGTDPGSKNDLPSWAGRTGNTYLGVEEEGELFRFYLQKK